MKKSFYRPEIDGLRAIAILPVIAYHLNTNFLKGGFLGVDIFFVISGYLITNLIISEIYINNFSIIHFFERRIRRIIPALYFVIILTMPLSWVLLSSGLIWDYWQSVAATSVFLSNFLFALEGDYFEILSKYKPFIHTWSLSIEEQFYVFLPFLFILFYQKFRFIIYTFLIFLISLSLIIFIFNFSLPFVFNINFLDRLNTIGLGSFFLTFGRLWELFVGSLIAMFMFQKKIITSNIFSIFGLTSLFLCLFLYNENFLKREFYTIIVIFSSSLILIYSSRTSLIGRLLSNKFLVKIGLISYSLYLVHQPIISFSNIIFYHNSIFNIIFNFIFIFILSYLIYIFIEKPFRNINFLNTKKIFFIFFTSSFLILFISINALDDKLIKLQNNNIINDIDLKYSSLILNIKEEGHLANNKINDIKSNLKFDINKKTILFIGDSQSWDWIRSLYSSELYNNFNFKIFETKTNCYSFKLNNTKLCNNFAERLRDFIYKDDISLIVLNHSLTDVSEINKINNLITFLDEFRNKILLVGNAEFIDVTLLSLSLAKEISKNSEVDINKYFLNISLKRASNIGIKLKEYAKLNGIKYVSEFKFFCIKNLCNVISNNYEPYIYDNMHFTKEGEKYMEDKITSYLRNLILN